MSRSGRGRRWFVPTILCVGLALVLLYTWQSGQDSPRAPLPMPEGGELAERVPDAAELTPEPASSDPVPRGDDRGVVTGEIRVPSSLGEKDGSGITISILCEGQILALTPATPQRQLPLNRHWSSASESTRPGSRPDSTGGSPEY